MDVIRNNEETVSGARVDKEAFSRQAKSAYQQICDLIARFQKIDAAIVESNATTKIKTSYGEFTIAGAIYLGFAIKGIVTSVKNSKQRKKAERLHLDQDKDDDGTNE